MRLPRTAPLVTALIVLALVVSAGMVIVGGMSEKRATVYFTKTIGLYEGDEVVILGVPVGKVDSIQPQGDKVRVELHYDASYQIPADAKAALVAPTLVTGRSVQFSPVYSGGPQLPDGGTIPVTRTAIPVEFDETKKQLNRLADGLGPKGLDKDGSLGKFLDSASHALRGRGQTLQDTLKNLSAAAGTLDDNSGNLFGTIANLQRFVTNLAASGQQIEGFTAELGSASQLLNENRTELSAALNALNPALHEVRSFVADNKTKLTGNLDSLTRISRLLVDKQDALALALHVAPTALSNFYNIYTPTSNSLTGVLALNNLHSPAMQVCSMLVTVGAPPQQCTSTLKPLLDMFSMTGPPIGLSPIERNGSSNTAHPPGGTPQQPPPDAPATEEPGALPGIGGGSSPKTLGDLFNPGGGN